MTALRGKCSSTAADARFELYTIPLKFDNPEACRQHGFPLDMQEAEVKEGMKCTDGKSTPH